MSIQAVAWVIENFTGQPGLYLVMLMVANAADRDGQNAYPGEERLAQDTRLSVRQVRRHLKVGVEKGWLTREERTTRRHHHKYGIPAMMSGNRHDYRTSATRLPDIAPNDGSATRPKNRPIKPMRVHFSKDQLTTMKNAIVEGCGWDPQHVGDSAWALVNKTAGELLKLKADPRDVAAFGAVTGWEGFGPKAIVQNWASYKNGGLIREGRFR